MQVQAANTVAAIGDGNHGFQIPSEREARALAPLAKEDAGIAVNGFSGDKPASTEKESKKDATLTFVVYTTDYKIGSSKTEAPRRLRHQRPLRRAVRPRSP